MRQESWRLELDEFIQSVGTEYPVTYEIYKDVVDGLYATSLYGFNGTVLAHSELVLIPLELQERIGSYQIPCGVTFTRFDVPLGLVNLLASKSEEYRVYMCRSLGVQ